MRRDGCKLASALLRWSIGEAAERSRDVQEYGHDAALQARRATGCRRLWRGLRWAPPFPTLGRISGRYGGWGTARSPTWWVIPGGRPGRLGRVPGLGPGFPRRGE